MRVKIKETGEIKELEHEPMLDNDGFIQQSLTLDEYETLDAGGLERDEDGHYVMTQDEYDRSVDYIREQDDAWAAQLEEEGIGSR